jgi:hypothetical protein
MPLWSCRHPDGRQWCLPPMGCRRIGTSLCRPQHGHPPPQHSTGLASATDRPCRGRPAPFRWVERCWFRPSTRRTLPLLQPRRPSLSHLPLRPLATAPLAPCSRKPLGPRCSCRSPMWSGALCVEEPTSIKTEEQWFERAKHGEV